MPLNYVFRKNLAALLFLSANTFLLVVKKGRFQTEGPASDFPKRGPLLMEEKDLVLYGRSSRRLALPRPMSPRGAWRPVSYRSKRLEGFPVSHRLRDCPQGPISAPLFLRELCGITITAPAMAKSAIPLAVNSMVPMPPVCGILLFANLTLTTLGSIPASMVQHQRRIALYIVVRSLCTLPVHISRRPNRR